MRSTGSLRQKRACAPAVRPNTLGRTQADSTAAVNWTGDSRHSRGKAGEPSAPLTTRQPEDHLQLQRQPQCLQRGSITARHRHSRRGRPRVTGGQRSENVSVKGVLSHRIDVSASSSSNGGGSDSRRVRVPYLGRRHAGPRVADHRCAAAAAYLHSGHPASHSGVNGPKERLEGPLYAGGNPSPPAQDLCTRETEQLSVMSRSG